LSTRAADAQPGRRLGKVRLRERRRAVLAPGQLFSQVPIKRMHDPDIPQTLEDICFPQRLALEAFSRALQHKRG
jgi:hypothetical protein